MTKTGRIDLDQFRVKIHRPRLAAGNADGHTGSARPHLIDALPIAPICRPVPGARIKYTYDLIARGIAWHRDIDQCPEFFELSRELKRRFAEL